MAPNQRRVRVSGGFGDDVPVSLPPDPKPVASRIQSNVRVPLASRVANALTAIAQPPKILPSTPVSPSSTVEQGPFAPVAQASVAPVAPPVPIAFVPTPAAIVTSTPVDTSTLGGWLKKYWGLAVVGALTVVGGTAYAVARSKKAAKEPQKTAA